MHPSRLTTLLIAVLIPCSPPPALAQEWLTEVERQWIAEHPSIVLGTSSEVEPAVIIRKNGQVEGAIPDLLALIKAMTGLNIKLQTVKPGTHLSPDILEDFFGFAPLAKAGITPENNLALTREIWKTLPTIFTRGDSALEIKNLMDIRGRRVAVRPNVTALTLYLKQLKEPPDTTPVRSAIDAFTLLMENKVDVYLGLSTDSYQLSHYFLPNIKVSYVDTDNPTNAGIAISKKHPQLLSILNKTIDRIGIERITALSAKWLNFGIKENAANDFLDKQERQWLRQHPTIKLGFSDDFPPWLIANDNDYSGILIDVKNELSQLLGINIDIVIDRWPHLNEQAKQRDIDGLLLITRRATQKLGLTATAPLFYTPRVFFARTDSNIQIHRPENLIGKNILYYTDSTPISPPIKAIADKVSLLRVSNPMEGLSALARGEGDLLAGFTSESYLIAKNNIRDIKPVYMQSNSDQLSLSVRDDWPELVSILNKAFNRIGTDRLQQIQRHWLGFLPITDSIFNAAEMNYISRLGPLRYDHRSNFPPIAFIDQRQQATGIVVDYIQLIAERLGTDITPTISNKLQTSIDLLRQHQADLILTLQDTAKNHNDFAFSDPFLSIPYVLIARKDMPIVKSLDDIKDKTIGTDKDSPAYQELRNTFGEDISLVTYDNIDDAIHDIESGELDGYVENEIFMDYIIRASENNNVKFAGTLPLTYRPSIAVRKEMAALIPIINKVLAEISDRERTLIYRRWVNYPIEKPINWSQIVGWITFIAIVVFIILATILYWNRKLAVARIEAEQANRAKSHFLANMSHEIRTPMNAILGFAEIIQQDTSLNAEHRRSLEIIRNAGNHLLSLINDILDISKIEAGRAVIHQTPCQLQKMLQELEQMFLISAQQKGLTLTVTGIDSVPEVILTDEGKLRQILINLIGNAIKFTRQGGICCHCESKLQDNEQVLITIRVEDSGPGIEERDREKIFSSFEQSQTAATEGGTGLGLAISKAYAQLMGGDITLCSEVGKGSCFSFYFPGEISLLTPKDAGDTTITSLDFAGKEFCVLVVDDIATNRKLVINILQPLGFNIVEADNGRTAIEQYQLSRPDIILMDARMPEMDGLQATHRIRHLDPHIPIVAITANVLERNLERFQHTGFNAILDKPFSRTELLQVISDQLGLAAICSPTASSSTPIDNNAQEQRGEKILIVDDIAVNRMLLDKILTPRGYHCHQCENGLETIELIQSWQPKLVLMDIQMPVMDGIEVLQRLQSTPGHTPTIVAVTAGDAPEEKQRLLALGVKAIITKPITLEKVDAILSEVLPHLEASSH